MLLLEHIAVTANHHKQVVEVVGDAARNATECVKVALLVQLFLLLTQAAKDSQ